MRRCVLMNKEGYVVRHMMIPQAQFSIRLAVRPPLEAMARPRHLHEAIKEPELNIQYIEYVVRAKIDDLHIYMEV